MMSAVMVTKPFIASLNKMRIERQVAVTKAINKSAIEYKNAIKLGMRQTLRMPAVTKVKIHIDNTGRDEPKKPKPRKPRGKRVKKTFFSKLVKRVQKSKIFKKKKIRKPRAKKAKVEKVHLPSVRGNPPAPDTGLLVNSIRADFAQNEGGKFEATATIGTEVRYARALEYELERPVWHPVWYDQIETIKKRIADAQNGKK